MNRLQLGDDEDVDIASWYAIFKAHGHSFANVFVEFVDRLPWCEDIFSDSSRTPKISIVVHFNLHSQSPIL
jgi:hypothetical protein